MTTPNTYKPYLRLAVSPPGYPIEGVTFSVNTVPILGGQDVIIPTGTVSYVFNPIIFPPEVLNDDDATFI